MNPPHSRCLLINCHLTISVRLTYTVNFGVDYLVEAYYTHINEVHILCE